MKCEITGHFYGPEPLHVRLLRTYHAVAICILVSEDADTRSQAIADAQTVSQTAITMKRNKICVGNGTDPNQKSPTFFKGLINNTPTTCSLTRASPTNLTSARC